MAKGDSLGELELYVMLAMAHLGPDAYGVTIRQEIARRARRDVSIGAVYATLGRLEGKGLITHELSDPQPVPGGRARKYFRLTGPGERTLVHSTSMLARMMQGWRPRTQSS